MTKRKAHKWNTTTELVFCENCLLWCYEGNTVSSLETVSCRKNGRVQENQREHSPKRLQDVQQIIGISDLPKKKPKKDIIRVGDKVTLLEPKIFIRAGYEPGFQDFCKQVEEKYETKIDEFINQIFSPKKNWLEFVQNSWQHKKVYKKIVEALAYGKVLSEMKDGKERKLILEEHPEWKDPSGVVQKIKYVKTGKYHSGSSSYNSYDGDYDYEPAMLYEEKTHKVLLLELNVTEEVSDGMAYYPNVEYRNWVLAEHCKKVS